MLMAFIVMCSLVPAISFAESVTSPEKTDVKDSKIQSKAKTVTYKITWNGNNGKIGTKKIVTTTVKKGSKLNKLAATPKRNGFSFKGWFTKKSGGTKITKNTRPRKSVTYYAQWSKGIINKNIDSKLLKYWKCAAYSYSVDTRTRWNSYTFYTNGTFLYWDNVGTSVSKSTGKYKASNGKIYFSNILYSDRFGVKPFKDTVMEYKMGKDNKGEYLWIACLSQNSNYQPQYYDIINVRTFRPT